MTERLISVGIILYKNDPQEIARCLDGLKSQTAKHLIGEVLIRDQGGGECREYVRDWQSRNLGSLNIKFYEGANLGFGSGHNALFDAIAESSKAYLCVNPDGIMHPKCVETIVAHAEETQWRGIFEAIQEPIMHPKKFNPRTGVTAWCSGACVLYPSNIYREIGGFDDDFFLYCEDVDISWRVKAAGYQCYTCSDAWFFHYAMDRAARDVEIWKSACILAHKWRSANFKNHALNVLASLVDIDPEELQKETEKFAQRPIEDVYRASPDFKHSLTFAEPMWTA
ncbi:glycosyl transferase [Caballeronia choica]|uniref:Glycosyl transferase n=1 Tax=Caballeronia choica TaxID=326476 RepID=A0A158L1L5_9BURK|nr:glycosyltransferase family 2 protein [Caballeronia choica]SAL87274.1 glycosyl transferase [Caballeronia choica]